MQAVAFILEGSQMMGIEEQDDVRVSTACSQSYSGNWPPKANIEMLDAKPESGNLEEELERIIMLADNFSEKALSTTEEDITMRKPKGKKNSKQSSMATLALQRRRSLRSVSADKSSMLLQPRLSPLAARAALAAAVTPLRQADQANLCGKSRGSSVHSATGKAGMIVSPMAKKDERKVKAGKEQIASTSVRRTRRMASACKQTLETDTYNDKRTEGNSVFGT